MNLYYCGIGSRKTPDYIQKQMVSIGKKLGNKGWTLRSGGAVGADSAFETGCDQVKGKKEIFLPWSGFNNNTSNLCTPSEEAMELASQFHPAWSKCSQGVRKLHARNMHQILGEDLEKPVKFVVCWTLRSGGTQQALRVAYAYNIPVYNLASWEPQEDLWEIVDG